MTRMIDLGTSLLVAAAALLVTLAAPANAAGDAAAGEKVFKKCMSCHRVGEGAKNLVGPVLNGVVGRAAGTAPDFAYSQLNKDAGAAGLVWTEENIVAYLADPSGFLNKFLTDKGKAEATAMTTKMTFKLPAQADREDVIAYLKTFSK